MHPGGLTKNSHNKKLRFVQSMSREVIHMDKNKNNNLASDQVCDTEFASDNNIAQPKKDQSDKQDQQQKKNSQS